MQYMDIKALKDSIKNKRIEWQRHSLERMLERNISRATVVEAILNGELIEDYSCDKPFPSALFFYPDWSLYFPFLYICLLYPVSLNQYYAF